MKIVNSIRDIYKERVKLINALQADVDKLISNNKERTWHYFSRIKALESFALKLETGRVSHPALMEDFFAATLVVENLNEIAKATELIERFFTIKKRRPESHEFTHKGPDSFPFDDLRLYVILKEDPSRPPREIDNIVFEIQIKTFLQHAWGIATHDLIYKSDNISWAKERVAYQIKAMLEQAEASISAAEKITEVPELKKTNLQTKDLNAINSKIVGLWSLEDLPKDRIRLSRNIQDLLGAIALSLNQLKMYLNEETSKGKGVTIKNLSPLGAIIQTIVDREPALFHNLADPLVNKKRYKLFLPEEVENFPFNEAIEGYIIRIKKPSTP